MKRGFSNVSFIRIKFEDDEVDVDEERGDVVVTVSGKAILEKESEKIDFGDFDWLTIPCDSLVNLCGDKGLRKEKSKSMFGCWGILFNISGEFSYFEGRSLGVSFFASSCSLRVVDAVADKFSLNIRVTLGLFFGTCFVRLEAAKDVGLSLCLMIELNLM